MQSFSGQDHFLVSGIGTKTIVESVHLITSSPIADKARDWLASHHGEVNEKNGDEPAVEAVPLLEDEMNDDEFTETAATSSAPTKATRRELRLKRKQEIEKHLSLKPNAESLSTATAESKNGDTMKSSAEQVVALQNELLALQTSFNQQLLDAARTKISTRDSIELNNKRLQDIHVLLKEEGEPPRVDVQLKFLPGEYTSCGSSQVAKSTILEDAKKLLLQGSIHDSDFLLHGDVQLSNAAQAMKAEATTKLQSESIQLLESTHEMINEFNDSLRDLSQVQLNVSLKLRLRGLLLDLYSRQIDVLLKQDAKVEQLHSELDGEELDCTLKSAAVARNSDLCALQTLIPIDLADTELNESGKPMLITKAMLKHMSIECNKLEDTLTDTKSKHLDLQKQRKRIISSIGKLQTELMKHQDCCKELQIQKFGKPVDSSVLDMAPVARADHTKEVEQLQKELETCHRSDVESAKSEHSKLKTRLLSATHENTKLLREVATLREQQLKLDHDVKRSLNTSSSQSKSAKKDEEAEYEKFRVMSCQQKSLINMLQLEIKSLKSKCGHVAMNHSLGHL